LQNEKEMVRSVDKIELINRLVSCGLKDIEATAFVSPKWVPQMADAAEVLAAVTRRHAVVDPDRRHEGGVGGGVTFSALTPNFKGLESAVASGAQAVAVMGSASDAFSLRNTNASAKDALSRAEAVCQAAASYGRPGAFGSRVSLPVRGYVSCAMGCPYQGWVSPEAVAECAAALLAMGCSEVAISDTIGTGTPGQTLDVLEACANRGVRIDQIAVHFHDTYGLALANILAALQCGVATVDSAVGGLGGCPYAGGAAAGNVATEDVVRLVHGLGASTGVDEGRLLGASRFVSEEVLGRPKPASRTAQALLAAASVVEVPAASVAGRAGSISALRA